MLSTAFARGCQDSKLPTFSSILRPFGNKRCCVVEALSPPFSFFRLPGVKSISPSSHPWVHTREEEEEEGLQQGKEKEGKRSFLCLLSRRQPSSSPNLVGSSFMGHSAEEERRRGEGRILDLRLPRVPPSHTRVPELFFASKTLWGQRSVRKKCNANQALFSGSPLTLLHHDPSEAKSMEQSFSGKKTLLN